MIVFAVRHERAHRWVPLDALDAQPTPSVRTGYAMTGEGGERLNMVGYNMN